MKRTIKRLALALAAVLLCFLVTGCEGGGEAGNWNMDMEGNEVASTTWKKNSDGGYTITRKYTINNAAVNANGWALVSQEVETGSGDLVTQVSRLYTVNREAMVNSLSLPTSDTTTERYVILTFHYSFPDRDNMDRAQIVYRDANSAIITIQYSGSNGALWVESGTPDNSIIYGVLKALSNHAVDDSSFQNAMSELSRTAFDRGDELCIETQIDRGAF